MNTARASMRRITAALLIAMLAYALANSLMNVLLNDIIDAFSISGVWQGSMSSTISIGTLAAVISVPLLQGRFSKFSVIVASGVLMGVGSVLTGLTPSFPLLIAVCVVLGVGIGWIDVELSAAMLDAHPDDSPKYLGILHGCFGIGGLLAPPLIALILLGGTWRGAYVSFGVLLLAATVAVFFLLHSAGAVHTHSVTAEQPISAAHIGAYLRTRRNWLLLACAVMAFTTQTGIVAWIMRYMQLQFDAPQFGAWSISAYWVCLTVNRFLAPRIPIAPMKLFTIGAALFAAVTAAGLFSANPMLLCVAIALGGLTSGHLIPVLLSECAIGYAGKTALTTTAVMLSMCLSRIAVPLFMAWMTAQFSPLVGMLPVPLSGVLAAVLGALACRGGKERSAA